VENRWSRWRIPLDLKMPEHTGNIEDTFQRIRKRFGLLEDWLRGLYQSLVVNLSDPCTCFRWIYSTAATTQGQTNFVLPAEYELEDNMYQLVFARTSFLYYGFDYTINEATK